MFFGKTKISSMTLTIVALLLTLSTKIFAIEIIAHRGASGFLPEHTKEALVLSFMQGADYIEQDLVATKDKQLIVLHDIHLERVTNVEEVFPERAREDGRFYAIDFTLEELRTLSIHERQNEDKSQVFPARYQGNAHFTVATFKEHVEIIGQLNRAFGKNIGLYPEIKAPSWHIEQGVDITALFIAELEALGLNNKDSKIYVQSFEPKALMRIAHEYKSEVKLIQLIAENDWNESDTDYDALRTKAGLAEVSSYAYGIGPWIPQVINLESKQSTELVKTAHELGLTVHAYTFRSDVIEADMPAEDAFQLLIESRIDGLFTDQVMPYMFSNEESKEK